MTKRIGNKQWLFVGIVALLLMIGGIVLATGASFHLFHLSLVSLMASTGHPDVISHSH